MVNFGNCQSELSNLISQLHDKMFLFDVSPNNASGFFFKLKYIALNRLHSVIWRDGVCDNPDGDDCGLLRPTNRTKLIFLCSFTLLVVSILLFTFEMKSANTALDAYLSNQETHQEWQQYLEPKRNRRNKIQKAADCINR